YGALFFFPSRRRHTRLVSDWSSDVCSSDLHCVVGRCGVARRATVVFVALAATDALLAATGRHRQRWLTKPLLMPVLMAGRDRPEVGRAACREGGGRSGGAGARKNRRGDRRE